MIRPITANGDLRDRAERPKGEIGARLDTPASVIDIAALRGIWRRGIVTHRLRGLAHLAPDVGLLGRIRGAFGTRLAAAASPQALEGHPCPWNPPCAFEPLFRKQGRMSDGFDHASPWTIAIDPRRGDLEVTLTVFGFANEFLAAVAEDMTAALRHDVDWRGRTSLFVPKIEIAGRRVVETEGIAAPPQVDRFVLDFISPLVITGIDPRTKPASLMTGLGQRIESLARWHDVTLGDALERRKLAPLARSLEYDFAECDVVRWTRGSLRQDRKIPMSGLLGRLEIGGSSARDPRFGAMLALGATCNLGADAAFGCGRYELTIDAGAGRH